jgi:hypothetical protein
LISSRLLAILLYSQHVYTEIIIISQHINNISSQT